MREPLVMHRPGTAGGGAIRHAQARLDVSMTLVMCMHTRVTDMCNGHGAISHVHAHPGDGHV